MAREKIKSTSKDELEWEVLASDRIALMGAAVNVLDAIQGRHALATLASVPTQVRLTRGERAAYDSALAFLKREFDKGAIESESHMKRSSAERAEELQPDSQSAEEASSPANGEQQPS